MTAQPDDMLWVSVKTSHDAFHLPSSPENTPLVMISAGTGIGPFRGFIQERASMAKDGHKLASAVLYHGCRRSGHDDIYAHELGEWESKGLVTVKRVFSRAPEESDGHKYVQDAVWADRDSLLQLWRQGCYLYVCGSKEISRAITHLAIRFKRDAAVAKGEALDEDDARNWWERLRNVRYAFDVFD
jgi:cytochrome P450/NADPH-cytochrome P450 reductase